jgi:hypothetical protein
LSGKNIKKMRENSVIRMTSLYKARLGNQKLGTCKASAGSSDWGRMKIF